VRRRRRRVEGGGRREEGENRGCRKRLGDASPGW
jgi:hypothetical protein